VFLAKVSVSTGEAAAAAAAAAAATRVDDVIVG